MLAQTSALSLVVRMTPGASVYGTMAEHPLVLVADDHDDSRVIARLVLENAGFDVVEASTGHEAISVARAQRPAAILLDMIMPELDGWDTARRLRSDSSMNTVAIIGLTALASASDRERSLAAGCDIVLTKPILPRKLVDVCRLFSIGRR